MGRPQRGPAKGAHPKGPVGAAPRALPPSEGLAHSHQDKRGRAPPLSGARRVVGARAGVGPTVGFFLGLFGDTGRV